MNPRDDQYDPLWALQDRGGPGALPLHYLGPLIAGPFIELCHALDGSSDNGTYFSSKNLGPRLPKIDRKCLNDGFYILLQHKDELVQLMFAP